MELLIDSLRNLFLKGWSAETCFPASKEKWTKENPTLGQCAITALIVNDLFGGQIVSNREYHHYWNILEDGTVIDFTKEQWGDITIETYEPTTREYILFSERGREFRTLERYQLLRKTIEREMLHIDYAPETLEESFTWLDKFLQDKDFFKETPEEEMMGIAHHGLGRWLRNKWNLWWSEDFAKQSIEENDSLYPQVKPSLNLYFESIGINHPDDMSGIVLVSYHRHLNGTPIELEKQVKKTINFYKNQKY
jgi:hypothetical protein